MDVFIFRRDLRIYDNKGLIELSQRKTGRPCLPIFIFNPKQIDGKQNKYYSNRAVQFMIQCINDLMHQQGLKQLQLFHGDDIAVLNVLVRAGTDIKSINFNGDFTPYAKKRDASIQKWCDDHNIPCFITTGEYALVDPSLMKKPYQVFTPFYKLQLKTMRIPRPRSPDMIKFVSLSNAQLKHASSFVRSPMQLHKYYKQMESDIHGSRSDAYKILHNIRQGGFKQYGIERDIPHLSHGTTRLSAYLKYGCVSVREAYHAVKETHGEKHPLIRELYWRAFYDQLVFHFPDVLMGQTTQNGYNKSLRPAYDSIQWSNNKTKYTAWMTGNTGFPFVDAGIRQLLQTGYMHNRLRMVTSSFLIKDLHCDWRIGEQFFATHLTDYYPSANNGGWQWSAGSGADAQQYTRIFNPWLQSFRFDPQAEYIKRWIPELRDIPPEHIHKWYVHYKAYSKTVYPKPIVIHSEQAISIKKIYKVALTTRKGKGKEVTQKGGRFLSSGSYGCVFLPAIRCDNKQDHHPNTISKVFDDPDEYQKELQLNKLIAKLDPDAIFTVRAISQCKVYPELVRSSNTSGAAEPQCQSIADGKRMQIIYEYGGRDLGMYGRDHKHDVAAFLDIASKLEPILNGIMTMTQAHIAHNDIKRENILYDGEKLRLIDFGMVQRFEDIFKRNRVDAIKDSHYIYYPLEYPCFNKIVRLHSKSRSTHYIPTLSYLSKLLQDNLYPFRPSDLYAVVNLNYKQSLKDFLTYMEQYPETIQNVFKQWCGKADVYALGMSLLMLMHKMDLLHSLPHRTSHKDRRRIMNILNWLGTLIDPNPVTRASIDQAITSYKRL
jgi:deoxyribodipyrimidine photo-lyase